MLNVPTSSRTLTCLHLFGDATGAPCAHGLTALRLFISLSLRPSHFQRMKGELLS